MGYLLPIIIVVSILLIFAWHDANGHTALDSLLQQEPLINIVEKEIPRPMTDANGITEDGREFVIDSIPLTEPVQPVEAGDVALRTISIDEKPHVSLTFDASVARNALMRSRDKRMYDAIANRTTDYYRPFYEEELRRNDVLDWWDDVAYPMNDSGECTLTLEQPPTDRESTPWESSSVPFARAI